MQVSERSDAGMWLRYAEEDLTVAKLLYRYGFYRHALFWTEQASEKILKMFIIEVLRAKELAPKFASIIDYYMRYAESDEDRKMLKKLHKRITRLSDPKSYQHICKEEHVNMVMLFFDMLLKAPLLPHMDKILKEYSDIRKKMSIKRYEKVFRETEKLIGEATSSIQVSTAKRCGELNASFIVQILRSFEEREDKVREAILNIVEKKLQKHRGDEIAEQAIKDACHIYTSFSDSMAVPPYFGLHTYLCQFFEVTRYPEGREIPKDATKSLPQIISLLRKNLERVRRLAGMGRLHSAG